MPTVAHQGKIFPVNDEGFLTDTTLWGPEWVDHIRLEEDIDEITEDHEIVMKMLQDYHRENGLAPMVRILAKVTGFKLKYIYELFPSGPGKGACKMAGLPKPEGCV
ncbi:MAG: TusE/DsrC/DsvC family sulfur relay protein [Candidatus Adiutrix sp.]